MSAEFVRRSTRIRSAVQLGAIALATAVAACGPSDLVGKEKLAPIKDGAKIAEVAGIIGEGPLTPQQTDDSMRIFHGFRKQMFISKGERYTIIWYRDTPGRIEDAITRQVETPIVLHADTVMGKGWSYFDDTADKLGLPNPDRAGERIDSISKAQRANKP